MVSPLAAMTALKFKAAAATKREPRALQERTQRIHPARLRGAQPRGLRGTPRCYDLGYDQPKLNSQDNVEYPTTYCGDGEKGYTGYPSLAQDRGEQPKAYVDQRWR